MGDLEDSFKGIGRSFSNIATFGGILHDPIGDELFDTKKFGELVSQQVAAQAPDVPKTLIDPGAMPSATSSDARKAKRKSYASQLARKGRASTIMTAADEDTLGA